MANKKTNSTNLSQKQLTNVSKLPTIDMNVITTKNSSEDTISIAFLINQLIKQQQQNEELDSEETLIY